jgi:hypothetical protein
MQSQLKTSTSSDVEDSTGYSTILPASGLMRRGVRLEVERSVDRSAVPASSCWPSPTTSDAAASRRHGYMIAGHSGTTLTDAMLEWYGLAESEDPPLVLNPVFCEELLGLPAAWTNVDDESASDALGMSSAQIRLF